MSISRCWARHWETHRVPAIASPTVGETANKHADGQNKWDYVRRSSGQRRIKRRVMMGGDCWSATCFQSREEIVIDQRPPVKLGPFLGQNPKAATERKDHTTRTLCERPMMPQHQGSGCFPLQAFPPLVTAPSFHCGLVYPAPSGRDRNCKDSVAPAYRIIPPKSTGLWANWVLSRWFPPLNMIKHFPRTKAR